MFKVWIIFSLIYVDILGDLNSCYCKVKLFWKGDLIFDDIWGGLNSCYCKLELFWKGGLYGIILVVNLFCNWVLESVEIVIEEYIGI